MQDTWTGSPSLAQLFCLKSKRRLGISRSSVGQFPSFTQFATRRSPPTMAETTAANGQDNGQNDQPQMMLQKIYIKDSSFEAPNAPQIFQEIGETQVEPQVQLNLSQEATKLSDEVQEVVLTVTLDRK